MRVALFIDVSELSIGYSRNYEFNRASERYIHGAGRALYNPQDWNDQEAAANLDKSRTFANVRWQIRFCGADVASEGARIGYAYGLKPNQSFDPAIKLNAVTGMEDWIMRVLREHHPAQIYAELISDIADLDTADVIHFNIGTPEGYDTL